MRFAGSLVGNLSVGANLEDILPFSCDHPSEHPLLDEQSELVPSLDGGRFLFEYLHCSFDKGCGGANSPPFDAGSLAFCTKWRRWLADSKNWPFPNWM